MERNESGQPDRGHEISRFQQAVHVGRGGAGSRNRAGSRYGARRGGACATPPAAGTTPAGPAAKPSPGHEAMVARERACGAEWKADKAAGKIQEGMKWPQYWSACNKRKKAEGM